MPPKFLRKALICLIAALPVLMFSPPPLHAQGAKCLSKKVVGVSISSQTPAPSNATISQTPSILPIMGLYDVFEYEEVHIALARGWPPERICIPYKSDGVWKIRHPDPGRR